MILVAGVFLHKSCIERTDRIVCKVVGGTAATGLHVAHAGQADRWFLKSLTKLDRTSGQTLNG